jgi:hypothetical protein
MRVILAMVVSAVLVKEQVTAQQTPTDSSVKQEVAALPSSSLVEVRIQGGNRLRGHIVNRGDADFTLEREKRAGTQTIAYDRVLSISQVNDKHSHKKWIIIGVVVAAVVVAVVVVVAIVKTQGPFAL